MWPSIIFHRIDKWLPADWPELSEDSLREAVENLGSRGKTWMGPASRSDETGPDRQTRVDILRAACCLFWHVFLRPDRYSAQQLEDLRNDWRYQYNPDEKPDWTRAYVNVHLAAALALHLHHAEDGYSEAMLGAVDDVAQLASLLVTADSLTEPGVYYQDDPEYYNGTVPLRKSLPIVCSLGWSIKFYVASAAGETEQAFESVIRAFECADIGTRVNMFFAEPIAAIEQVNASVGLVGTWLRCQEVAGVFDQIHNAVEPKVNWEELANRCEDMKYYYDQAAEWADENRFLVDKYVKSEIGKIKTESGSEWTPYYPLGEFWTFARGLCVTRLSPDAYRKVQDNDRRHEAKDRLSKYFFKDVWEDIPRDAQDALIAADRTYWAEEGRKGDILENLRLAMEPVIEQRLAGPFRAWRSKRAEGGAGDARTGNRETFLRISMLLHELWDNRALFENFAKDVFLEVPLAFWDDLRDALYDLRDLRGATAHPEGGNVATAHEITERYGRFIGIDQRGFLPYLLALRPKEPPPG